MVVFPLGRTLRGAGSIRQLAWALACLAVATTAHAHGRPPSLNQVIFDPNDPSRIIAQATWGAVLTEDGGVSWEWICAASMGVRPRNQDPRMAIADDGRLVVGTFDGLVRGDPRLCDFTRPEPALADEFVIDVAAVPGRANVIYALRTSSLGPDQLFVSDDAAASFTAVGRAIDESLVDRLLVGVDDPDRIYLSSAVPRGVGVDRLGFVFTSTDGGDDLAPHPFAFEGMEWNLLLLAVDPTDAQRVLAHTVHFDGEDIPERVVLSEDAGRTWTTVARVTQVGGAAFSDDGAEVLVGSRTGGLSRSRDSGRSFTLIDPAISVRCIARRGDEVFVCTDPSETRVALLRSPDGGDTFEPALHFDQIGDLPDCPRCSDVDVVCPAWFPDVAYDLGLDASIPDGAIDPDAGTGLPREVEIPPKCRDAGFDVSILDAAVPDGSLASDADRRTVHGGGGCSTTRVPSTAWPLALLVVFIRPRRRTTR